MKIKITKKPRDGKIALWVDMPNLYNEELSAYNIWDLPKKLADNEEVMKAIRSAFELGMRFVNSRVLREISKSHSVVFEEEDV